MQNMHQPQVVRRAAPAPASRRASGAPRFARLYPRNLDRSQTFIEHRPPTPLKSKGVPLLFPLYLDLEGQP